MSSTAAAAPAIVTRPGAVTHAQLAQLLFMGVVWGGAFLFLRIASPEVGPVWTAELRLAIAAAVLVAIAGPRAWRAVRAAPLEFVVVGVAFGSVPFLFVAFAVATLPAGVGAVLNATTPLFTMALGAAFLGQRVTVRLAAGLVTGFAAVVLLVGWSPLPLTPGTLLAALAALGAALSYAIAGTFVRRRMPGVGPVELATGQLVVGALALLPFAVASGIPAAPSPASAVAIVAVATISTAVPWPMYLRLLKTTSPTVASTVTFIVPAFAMTWAMLVLGEPVGPELLLGFGLIIASLVLVLRIRVPVPAVVQVARARLGAPAAV